MAPHSDMVKMDKYNKHTTGKYILLRALEVTTSWKPEALRALLQNVCSQKISSNSKAGPPPSCTCYYYSLVRACPAPTSTSVLPNVGTGHGISWVCYRTDCVCSIFWYRGQLIIVTEPPVSKSWHRITTVTRISWQLGSWLSCHSCGLVNLSLIKKSPCLPTGRIKNRSLGPNWEWVLCAEGPSVGKQDCPLARSVVALTPASMSVMELPGVTCPPESWLRGVFVLHSLLGHSHGSFMPLIQRGRVGGCTLSLAGRLSWKDSLEWSRDHSREYFQDNRCWDALWTPCLGTHSGEFRVLMERQAFPKTLFFILPRRHL